MPRFYTYSHRCGIELREAALVPVRISQRRGAGGIEFRNLRRRQVPAERTELLAQLLFVSRTDDDRGDRRALQQPVQRNLRHGLSGFPGHLVQCIADIEDMLVRNRRTLAVGELALQPGGFRQRLSAAQLAEQPAPAGWVLAAGEKCPGGK